MDEARPRKESRRSLLAEACRQHGRLLFRLAYGVLHDAHAAEDMCQRAFLAACRQPERTVDPAHWRAWLARVVINESLQLLRRRKREQAAQDRRPTLELEVPRRDDASLREAVLAALAELPDVTRAVVVLRIMQGLSGNAAKELLGCSAAEVSRRLYQGMERLRTLLADVASGAER